MTNKINMVPELNYYLGKISVLTVSNGIESEKSVTNRNTETLLKIAVPRKAAVLQLYASFYNEFGYIKTYCAAYLETHNGMDIYTIPLGDIVFKSDIYHVKFDCDTAYGKKYFSFVGNEGYFSDVEGKMFQLLVTNEKYETPNWFGDGIIYHIFVDRFFKAGKTPKRKDAVYYEDWYNTVPEYPQKIGDFLRNNTFFGGNLWGVIEKLDYIQSLGAETIYLSPIFKAYSNHKYDTGDYLAVDECFGGDEALASLLAECEKRGMKVILDGVFNHVGEDSIYFNKFGKYKSLGAFQSKQSRYYSWFNFFDYPEDYDSWWGIKNLPKVNKIPEFKNFICDEVISKYMDMGISGFRLDVADELDGEFLKQITHSTKSHKKDAVVVGEVWEDASCKAAYGEQKHYFDDDRLDSVTNYPLRNGLISFLTTKNSRELKAVLRVMNSHYPSRKHNLLMNILGTHDTERILTVLGGESSYGLPNSVLAEKKLSPESREYALNLLKHGYAILSALPGVPCVYYGDEAGMEGYHDPFNRRTFPWGKESKESVEFFSKMGKIRKENKVLKNGTLRIFESDDNILAFERYDSEESIIVIVNYSDKDILIPLKNKYLDLFSKKSIENNVVVEKSKIFIAKRKATV